MSTRGILENTEDSVVYHEEDIWITKISIPCCSAMMEMHSGERNACPGLELSVPCRKLFHHEGCHHHLFPSRLSHHTLPCPSNVGGVFRSPGRFLFCFGVFPQETVFRLHRISHVEKGWEMHWDSASGSCSLSQTWSWALLRPCWLPSTGREWVHFPLLPDHPVLRQNIFSTLFSLRGPKQTSIIQHIDAGLQTRVLKLFSYIEGFHTRNFPL